MYFIFFFLSNLRDALILFVIKSYKFDMGRILAFFFKKKASCHSRRGKLFIFILFFFLINVMVILIPSIYIYIL